MTSKIATRAVEKIAKQYFAEESYSDWTVKEAAAIIDAEIAPLREALDWSTRGLVRALAGQAVTNADEIIEHASTILAESKHE